MPPALFTPFAIRNLALANRIVVSPMCQYSAVDGLATDWHLVHLGQFALGGAGLVWIEATGVEPRGRITPACLGLWSDAHAKALEPVVAFYRKHGAAKLGIQLAHAGRKASSALPWLGGRQLAPGDGGWRCVAPSPIPQNEGELAPSELSAADVDGLVEAFATAARRAAAAGFDAVEVHAAHGYLLHEFLSPLANRRADELGGTLENRMRVPLRVARAVRDAFPADRPVGVRISATDWVEGGWTPDDSVVLARRLRDEGVDWVDCSSGGVSRAQSIPLGPGYQVPLSARVRREAEVTTVAVGLITDPHHAEQIVADGDADLVALARGVLWDPRWGWHAAAELGASVEAPPQYYRSEPVPGTFRGATHGTR